jgi:fructose-1,6-bisphosphatase II
MKQLLLDFLRVTQEAALAAAPWVGRGRKHEADAAATAAMRETLRHLPLDGIVVIGEGELDEAPMLQIGERVGTGQGPGLDIAVDPLEGTNLVAGGLANATAVIAAAPRGSLLHAPDIYMEKLAVGRQAAGAIDLGLPIVENMRRAAAALGKRIADMTVMIQARERHRESIEEIQRTGARVKLFDDGDVTYTIAPAFEGTGVDMFYGVGGAPEGVIAAVALKCLGGEMQARLLPANDAEYARCVGMGLADPRRRLSMRELVASDDCLFAATGVTSGLLLEGVKQEQAFAAATHSLLAYGGSGTLHFIRSVHPRTKAG